MIAKATITSKAQVTIPKSIRDAANLRDGDKVVFVMKDNREIVLRKWNRQEQHWLSLAESSFSEWENPEDSVYDRL